MEFEDENELVKRCRKNDRQAQEALFKKHASKMLAICQRYSHNHEDAKDLLHDGFYKIFTKISAFKGNSSLETWMTRLFINLCLDAVKKKGKNSYADIENIDKSEDNDEADFEITIGNITGENAINALQKLPHKYSVIINLYVIDGYAHKEISELLGIPEGTSKSNLSRGIKLLVKLLKPQAINHEKV